LGLLPPPIFMPPIEIGIKQLQQISVKGLTNLPRHVTFASTEKGKKITITNMAICFFKVTVSRRLIAANLGRWKLLTDISRLVFIVFLYINLKLKDPHPHLAL